MGLRDIENNVVELARRDTKEKKSVSFDGLAGYIKDLLEEIQANIFQRALAFRNENIREANTWEEFVNLLDTKAGFVSAHWDGTGETEDKIKEQTKATIRCIPLNNKQEDGTCILTGKPSTQRVLFARAY
jgi:prolyl-tRNA synthetase